MPDSKKPMTDILKAADEAYSQTPLRPEETDVDPANLAQASDKTLQAGDYVNVTHRSDGTIDVQKADPVPLTEMITESGQLAVEFGPTNEFSERRRARLQDDAEELIREVKLIDAQIAHLNARRTDAMLAYSGISADLTALDKDVQL